MSLEAEEARVDTYFQSKGFESLKLRKDIQAVYRSNHKFETQIGNVRVIALNNQKLGLLIQVSKKNGNAVIRNKIKRRIRAAVRQISQYGSMHNIGILLACNRLVYHIPFSNLLNEIESILVTCNKLVNGLK